MQLVIRFSKCAACSHIWGMPASSSPGNQPLISGGTCLLAQPLERSDAAVGTEADDDDGRVL